METFFKSLSETGIAQFSISISFNDTDCAVSLLPKTTVGDDGLNDLPPFTLRGNITEIDAVFLEKLKTPMEATKTLIDNSKGYLDNLKKAEEKTKWAKDKKERKKKAVDALKELVKGKDFNPLNDHEKAVELANKVLELDENDTLAKKTIADMNPYKQPSFF